MHCHWCCHPFDSDPIRLPICRGKAGEFHFGPSVYCSIDCCRAAATRARGTPELSLLRCWWREVDPESCRASPSIPTAPPFEALDIFGGSMTIKEFRAGSVTFPNPRVSRGDITRLMIPNETHQVHRTITEPMYHLRRPSCQSMGRWLQS